MLASREKGGANFDIKKERPKNVQPLLYSK